MLADAPIDAIAALAASHVATALDLVVDGANLAIQLLEGLLIAMNAALTAQLALESVKREQSSPYV